MTDHQPEALQIAAKFESFAIDHAPNGWPAIQQRELTNAAITLRTQHAAIERKDALLRQALEALGCTHGPAHRCGGCGWYPDGDGAVRKAITKELK